MELTKSNYLHKWDGDGQDRSKIPPVTPLIFVLRGAQVAFAFIVLVLCAVAVNQFNELTHHLINLEVDATSFAFFSFTWTAVYFIYLGVTAWRSPSYYHIIAQLALEAFSVLWWLVCFALLASRSNVPDIGVDSFDTGFRCMKAAAAMGAVEFVLFCVTAFFTVQHFLSHRSQDPALQIQQPAVSMNTPTDGPHQLGTQQPYVQQPAPAHPQP